MVAAVVPHPEVNEFISLVEQQAAAGALAEAIPTRETPTQSAIAGADDGPGPPNKRRCRLPTRPDCQCLLTKTRHGDTTQHIAHHTTSPTITRKPTLRSRPANRPGTGRREGRSHHRRTHPGTDGPRPALHGWCDQEGREKRRADGRGDDELPGRALRRRHPVRHHICAAGQQGGIRGREAIQRAPGARGGPAGDILRRPCEEGKNRP